MSACGMVGSKISTFGPRSGFIFGFFCAIAPATQPVATIQASRRAWIAKSVFAGLKKVQSDPEGKLLSRRTSPRLAALRGTHGKFGRVNVRTLFKGDDPSS